MKKMSTPAKNNGTGLEDVNIPGQAYLREALTSCTDPLKAIESFQVCLRCRNGRQKLYVCCVC